MTVMEFHTKLNLRPYRRKIDYSMNGLSIGSCFAENIAAKLRQAKFPVVCNPFGVLYNPYTVADTIDDMDTGKIFAEDDLVREGDLWSCFSFHGSFSSTDPAKALAAMNKAASDGREALRKADYVILTFGTAWIYELNPDYGEADQVEESLLTRAKRIVRQMARPRVVANCHKFPARAFSRRRLTVGEIVDIYSILLDTVLADKLVLLSVSPVRHIKDGLEENNVSKATLLLAVSELAAKYDNVEYFPAFEIVNDELRDYRFYKEDMVHPSDQAVEYIWKIFGESLFSKKTADTAAEIAQIVNAAAHRPLNPDSLSHRRFLRSMLKKAEAFQKKYPKIDLSQEIDYFST